jgi:hypothetical protein
LHDDRRIQSQIRKVQKHVDPVDPDSDPQHCSKQLLTWPELSVADLHLHAAMWWAADVRLAAAVVMLAAAVVMLAAAVVRLAAAVVMLAAAVAGLALPFVGMALPSSLRLPLERCSLGWSDFYNHNKQASKQNSTVSKRNEYFTSGSPLWRDLTKVISILN